LIEVREVKTFGLKLVPAMQTIAFLQALYLGTGLLILQPFSANLVQFCAVVKSESPEAFSKTDFTVLQFVRFY